MTTFVCLVFLSHISNLRFWIIAILDCLDDKNYEQFSLHGIYAEKHHLHLYNEN